MKKWGLGIGYLGLRIGDRAKSPIPNPHSPNNSHQKFYVLIKK